MSAKRNAVSVKGSIANLGLKAKLRFATTGPATTGTGE